MHQTAVEGQELYHVLDDCWVQLVSDVVGEAQALQGGIECQFLP